jgi:polyphosphate glucokinase
MEVLGIDVGGTGIKGAPVNIKTGELLKERYRIETPQPATPEAIGAVIKQIVNFFNWEGKIGIGFPSVVKNGEVLTASNIDNSWIGIPINKYLSEITECEVLAVNDADAAGLAELYFGGGSNMKGIVLLLTIGTGVGSVLFIDGKLIPNTELGHLKFKKKTIEDYVSNSVREKKEMDWNKWGNRFNNILKHYERLFYPDLIIIGGGISKKMDKFEEFITVKTKVIPAHLMNEAGIIGAALFAAKE